MERFLFFAAFFSCFFSLPAQDITRAIHERNPKFHRFRSITSSQKLRVSLFAKPQPLDTLSIQEVFPSLTPEEGYTKLRNEYDVELRQSTHTWRYNNHKHRKSAEAYIKFRLIPDADRLSYPRKKKRQGIF